MPWCGSGQVMTMMTNPTARTTTTTRSHLPIALAAIVSVVAVAVAVTAHLAFGVGETPLVIGTLVVASIIGWVNADRRSTATVTPMPGGSHRSHGLSHAA